MAIRTDYISDDPVDILIDLGHYSWHWNEYFDWYRPPLIALDRDSNINM